MFYFDIFFKDDSRLGGHNCTDFETRDGLLIIQGYDYIPYINGTEKLCWRSKYELSKIKEFKIEIMKEENEK